MELPKYNEQHKNNMTISQKLKELKENHLILMVLTCVLPLVSIFIGVYYFGIEGKYLWWVAIGICMISHLFMMKTMHGNHTKKEIDSQDKTQNKEQRGNCH